MKQAEFIQNYYGVGIYKSCGFFYPDVNGNVECETIFGVKRYIREFFLVAQNNRKKFEILFQLNNFFSKGETLN